jgi:hypothetical protein
MFYVAVGMKGIGKTYQTIRIIDQYVRGNPSVGMKPRKVLLFDVNNEYKQYKEIAADPDTILQFAAHSKIEARRISATREDGKVKSDIDFQLDLRNILDNFRNGLLVLEDMSLFVGDSVGNKLIGALCTNRHRDLDIITHFQSIAKAGHPKFKALSNVLRLHKTSDSCTRVAAKFMDDYPKIRIGELIVNKRFEIGTQKVKEHPVGSNARNYYENDYRRFFLHIDYEKHTITGKFTKEEFVDACREYLNEEAKFEITPLVNMKDEKTGKKKYTYQQAFELKLNSLMRYYGNPS